MFVLYTNKLSLLLLVLAGLTGVLCSGGGSSYDSLLSAILASNQAAKEDFLTRHPSGHSVLQRYADADYQADHPVLVEGDGDHYQQVSDDKWAAFLDELHQAHAEATNTGSKPRVGSSIGSINDVEEEGAVRPLDQRVNLPSLRSTGTELGEDNAEEDNSLENRDSSRGVNNKEEPMLDGSSERNGELMERRTEVAFQNPLWGEHRVSGGSSELGQWINYALVGAGAQDENEDMDSSRLPAGSLGSEKIGTERRPLGEKVDRLPTYCDPPNPCPIGHDASRLASPCDNNVADTKSFNRQWIWRKMESGECLCDEEHMHQCPAKTHHTAADGRMIDAVEEAISEEDPNNPYMRGNKRNHLVAKKSMHGLRRSKRGNPYLAGTLLKRVVKKNGHTYRKKYAM